MAKLMRSGFQISLGMIYLPSGGPRRFEPPHRFSSDKHTLALWDFNDEEGANRFEDTSGNGYTLIGMNGATTGVALAVNPANTSLTTTWGQIKLESRDIQFSD